MLVVIITITVDSQIGIVADFIPKQLSSAGFYTSYSNNICSNSVFVLSYVKQSNKDTRASALYLDMTQIAVSIAQYVLAGILAFIIFQILTAQQYNLATLYVTYAISYGLWVVTLSLLARAFFSWYRSYNKSVLILILTLSMIAYVINGVTWAAASFAMLTQQKPVITSKDVAHFPEFSSTSPVSQIQTTAQIASGVAYVLTWVATVMLLQTLHQKTR